MKANEIVRRAAAWTLALLGMFAVSVAAAHWLHGGPALVVAMAIATTQAAFVIIVLMDQRRAPAATRFAAAAGFIWLLLLLALTFADVATRAPAS
ncbi:MAG: hypothetical protein R3E87_17490 [Burkholderiaceae bacterium]